MKDGAFVLGLTAVTSALAYLVARRGLGLSRNGLRAAAARMLDVVGVALIFAAANGAVGLAIILAVRGSTSIFVSAYLLNDVTIVAISLLQGLVFASWWERR